MFEPRTYRNTIHGNDLVSFTVTLKETDLYIRATKNLKGKAERLVTKYRQSLEKYISRHPDFLSTLEPYEAGEGAPLIIKAMAEAGQKAGTGPMAAVAGTIAEFVGKELLEYSPEMIIENGGDIFLKSLKKRHISVFAGKSSLSEKISIEIDPDETPLGICTSSGTIGHSLSYGNADAVVVLSPSTPLADAAATAIGNIVQTPEDIPSGLEKAETIPGVKGVLIIIGDKAGAWGDIKLDRPG
ncbi:MAG: UPF0280 family protein [Dehalococcoidales bacterium]|nr:UPF0280 family protein [Dehalococcoidales bacterium]